MPHLPTGETMLTLDDATTFANDYNTQTGTTTYTAAEVENLPNWTPAQIKAFLAVIAAFNRAHGG
jgi:hypothetical protein